MFQPFILHITCLWFAGILAKPKHVGNAFTYWNLTNVHWMTVTLSSGATTLFKIFYISSTFTNIIPFISISFCCSPLKQGLFVLPYVIFWNKNLTFFASFIISVLRMTNSFFASKNKNCRIYHGCDFEFTDWLIWLVH